MLLCDAVADEHEEANFTARLAHLPRNLRRGSALVRVSDAGELHACPHARPRAPLATSSSAPPMSIVGTAIVLCRADKKLTFFSGSGQKKKEALHPLSYERAGADKGGGAGRVGRWQHCQGPPGAG